jgi:hypothetical protein
MLEVHSCRKRGQRGSRVTARSFSSPQIERKLSSSPHQGKAMGVGLCFWEVKVEVWGSNESEKEGREGLGPFISRQIGG